MCHCEVFEIEKCCEECSLTTECPFQKSECETCGDEIHCCETCRWNFGDSAAETYQDCHGSNWESCNGI